MHYLTTIILAVSMAGCTAKTEAGKTNEHETETIKEQNTAMNTTTDSSQRKLIEDYAAANNLKGEFTPSGLYVVIDNPGTGENPKSSSTVKVEYTGYFLDGKKFDGTPKGSPIEFGLFQVITGWTEGIPYFKKGGSGKLIIPSDLAYGPRGQGPIPASAVLVFDVLLVDFR